MDEFHQFADAMDARIRQLFKATRRIAVLGIKPGEHAGKPAFYVPQYLCDCGFEILPVPVYYPEVTHILGQPVCRSLAEIDGEVDLVNVFRRSEDIPAHLDELLARRPKAVWLQLGIRNDAVAARLEAAGIFTVQDRCIMLEHRRLAGG